MRVVKTRCNICLDEKTTFIPEFQEDWEDPRVHFPSLVCPLCGGKLIVIGN